MDKKRLYRSRQERMVCGVCGGIAEYFDIDPTIIRLIWVLVMVSSCGTGLLAYFIAAVIIPDQPQT
ncbi:MAG TPA: PspC domain-containing protein [Candidatus Bariatricus faecipullorum]|nr:PspC domain-containing protein [Candidatus Bariatricus faecipullorum]